MLLSAPAKINLGLQVLHRRPDGYHEINTVFAAVDLCDELELTARDDGRIVCRVEGNPQLAEEPAENNLCVRAARALREAAGVREGADLLLRKGIPTGAGLGGGSSDAAAVLAGCARLWNLSVAPADLAEIGAQLGSDVPFFLGSGPAVAGSRGEVLEPLDLFLPWAVLLVNPGIHVPTPWAYRALNRTDRRPADDLAAALRGGMENPHLLRERLVNDFEEAVFAEHPELKRIKERMYDAGALLALMSGSGSTMFGLFADGEGARKGESAFGEYWSRTVGFC